MDKSELNTQNVEYIYKEYVRLSNKYDLYQKSSFDDFKLLGVIGFMFAWKPIIDFELFETDNSSLLLLFGFIAILFIVAIIAIHDLLKRSLINYYRQELCFFEAEIRASLGQPETNTFRFAEHWKTWSKQKHRRIAFRFHLLFYLLLGFFPTIVLLFQESFLYAGIYASVVLIVLGIFINTMKVHYGK